MLFSASRIYRQVTSPIKLGFFCIVLSSISFCSFASSLGNNAPLKFKQLTIEEGLSQSNVFSIVEDHYGFVWIATENGLNRYDGENFKYFKKSIGDKQSLSNNFVRKVYIDSKKNLWVGTQSGLNLYDRGNENFTRFLSSDTQNTLRDNVIWDIYEDNKGVVWVSTELGLHKFESESSSFTRVHVRGFDNQLREIKTIFQDQNNKFWLGTFDKGIYLASDTLNSVVSLDGNNTWGLNLGSNSLNDIKRIEDNYWLATNNGLLVVNSEYKISKLYTEKSDDELNPTLLSNTVKSIEVYTDSEVLVGTTKGINIIDVHTGRVSEYTTSSSPKSISENWINDIYKDSSSRFWIGTYGNGLNILDSNLNVFSHYLLEIENNMIDAFVQSKNGTIWFLSQKSGLNKINADGKFSLNQSKISSDVFQLQYSDNNIWLYTFSNDLYQYHINTGKTTLHSQWQEHANYNHNIQFKIRGDKIFFVDTSGAMRSYNTISHEFKIIESSEKIQIIGFAFDKEENIFAIDKSNNIFREVEDELVKSELHINFQNHSLIKDIISLVVADDKVWFSTLNGIYLIDLSTLLLENYIEEEAISAMLQDDAGNIWASHNRNISVIERSTLTVKTFGSSYGIGDNDFITDSALKSKDGTIFFGGINGFHTFDPVEVLSLSPKITPPTLTGFFIENQEFNISNSSNKTSLTSNINQVGDLILQHAQSPFSIKFISPNTQSPSRVNYRYKLNGLEDNWINSGKDNLRATYTNLSPGEYIFELQAYDIYNQAHQKSKTLAIKILPPWWLSNSAIFVYSLLVLAIIAYFLQQMRHKRLYHLQIKLSEERLKLSLWGSGDEMWDWNIKTGRIYRSNIWGILEFPQDGKRNVGTDQTNIHQQDIPRVRAALNDHFEDKTEHFESTYRVKDKNDQWIWVLDRGKIVERDDKKIPTRMTGTLKDISQIKRAEENLKLFAKCIENISDAVVIYDRQFNVVDVNKAFQRITNKSKKSMIGTALRFSNYPEHFTVAVKKHLITKGSWHGEVESQKENNEKYLTDLNIDIIRDENKHISHFVGVFSDITKRKETEAELRRLASSDTLTGLPNRSYFQANQKRLVDSKIPHALLVFDLDNFKKINDSMGHEVGDALLCKVAQRILTIGRKQDTVYRLGGDEFSLLIENTNDIHTITSIAKEILRTIALPFKLKNQEIVLYSSIGIVLYPEDGTSPEELLKNADTAMYHAKDLGGNNYQFFNDSMNKQAVKRLQIENLIRHGLKEDYFSVFYQPKIEISTGKVAGMEALVRFETPSKGIVSPVVFIPVSEETGQIIDIGEIVLRKACHATKQWVDAGLFDGRIAVNLSAVQFTQPNLVGMIANTLKESGLAPKYLELEITEGTVMDSPQKAIDTMLQIRAMGVHLSLDDFGTGYSSLAYLKKFPLNTLKIDKAFVDDIETSEQGRNMVATIVTIAHNLDLQVVAEGVETNQQLSFLAGLRCEQLQGYLYSKPLPEPDFQKYLLSHQITDRSTSFGKI